MTRDEMIKDLFNIVSEIKDSPKSRENSLAITKIEEAILWLKSDYVFED